MPIEIRKKPDMSVLRGLRELAKNEVLVGVPAENAGRASADGEPNPLNYAEIGYVLEHGSTVNGGDGNSYVIPPRPHLRPGIEDAREKITAVMKNGLLKALEGDPAAAEKALEGAGIVAQNAVHRKIENGPFAPLAPATIHRRRTRKEAPRDGTKPLIDTGTYRKFHTYVVRPKDKPGKGE